MKDDLEKIQGWLWAVGRLKNNSEETQRKLRLLRDDSERTQRWLRHDLEMTQRRLRNDSDMTQRPLRDYSERSLTTQRPLDRGVRELSWHREDSNSESKMTTQRGLKENQGTTHVAGAAVIPLQNWPEKMLVFFESLPYTSLEIALRTIFHPHPR